jgi:peptide deformylase
MDIKIINEDSKSLREVSRSWDFTTDGDPTELVSAMAVLMIESKGIGLAAPQCGINKRLFIMGNLDKLVACINPEIVSGEGEVKDLEGCLSFPGLWLRVNRYEKVNVKYQNTRGETIELTLDGLAARVFQHEYDHLDGVCFDTRVGKTSLELAKEKRRRKKLR